MSLLNKLLSSRQNEAAEVPEPVQSDVDGCVKCGKLVFEYDEYFNEYTCESCGWTISQEPNGDIEIIKTRVAKNAEKQQDETAEDTLSETMPLEEMNTIIQDYGRAMVHKAPPLGGVADVSKLPHPKSKIKKALIQALNEADGPELVRSLKDAYLRLSVWQKDVGEQPIGIDLAEFATISDLDEQASAYLEQEQQIEQWKHKVNSEVESLEDDLNKLDLWQEDIDEDS